MIEQITMEDEHFEMKELMEDLIKANLSIQNCIDTLKLGNELNINQVNFLKLHSIL